VEKYKVTRENGSVVKIGDVLVDFRGEEWFYEGCTHPRKVQVYQGDRDASWPGKISREFYAELFDVTISEL
jgi:hypothetical protein